MERLHECSPLPRIQNETLPVGQGVIGLFQCAIRYELGYRLPAFGSGLAEPHFGFGRQPETEFGSNC